jgi:hypothetical protein
MARPKGAKNVKKHVFKDPTIEEIVEMEVEVKDPVTGKMIKQKVKVKRLKAIKNSGPKEFVGATSVLDDLEQEENERLLFAEPDPEE